MTISLAALAALTGAGMPGAVRADMPDRGTPPTPGPLPAFQIPVPDRATLSNGIVVHHGHQSRAPLTDVVIAIRSGASSDPTGLPGMADWTASMLSEGAAGKSALEFADAVDFLGASLSAAADWESTVISLHVPSARVEEALALMADMLMRPEFPEAEWKRLRENRRTAFLEARDDPQELARIARIRALFGTGHRYGHPLEGTPPSLEKARLDGVRSFHRAHYRPENVFIVSMGDIDDARMRTLLENTFGRWNAAEASTSRAPEPGKAPAITKRDIVLVDKPEAAQSVITAMQRAPQELRPLSAADDVMNTLLGGSFTSRLNNNLREQHGYTYGARSGFDLRRFGGAFMTVASVATDVTAPAVREMMNEIERIVVPATDDEVVQARRYLGLGFPARFETGRQVAGFWAWAMLHDVQPAIVTGYMEAAEAVDVKALAAAAQRDIHPEEMRIVIVGDRKKVEAPLRELDLGPIQVWTVNDLLGPVKKGT